MPTSSSSPTTLPVATHPRVEVAPSYAYSLGSIGIKLMKRAGKPLDFWQQQSLTLMMARQQDGLWACVEYAELVSRQNGKGGILEARALAGLLVLGEELIMWSAHEVKTALEAHRRVKALLLALGTQISDTLVDVDGVLIKIVSANGAEAFERMDTGARIKFIARSKGSGRGFSGDVNIIDEAFAFTPEQQDALMPTLLARPNPQFIYMSSPPLDANSGEVLFSLQERAEEGGDDAFAYRDWGIEGDLDQLDQIDLNDHRLWAQANPALTQGRLTIGKITRLRKALRSSGGRGFARECLGLWPRRRESRGAINVAQWNQLADPDSRRVGDVALAVDIAPNRDWAAIALYGVREDGIGHVQVLDYRAGTDWLVARLVELREVLDPVAIAMGRGTGASLETDLTEAGITVPDDPEKPRRGQLLIATFLDMSAACGQLLDAVKQSAVHHLGQDPLDDAVAVAKVRETTDAIAWARKGAEADISPLVAATLARYALRVRAPLLVADDYDVLDSIV
ncbi:hypothetical protein [Umezawaea beigongshangensis]|uniref:hypothetical protein n=1 Tax=Umezawaea beigongshangensis TaxID=2780383 RepID=UPI0018F12A33|nr:hypothetical protein [Umezawaea beigongshangensis]